MIERKFVKEKIKEFQIREFIDTVVHGAGHSTTDVKRTPLGDKIVINAAKPGMVVGRKGSNIKDIGEGLKQRFDLENPQVEISEVMDPFQDAKIVAEKIVTSLERFGAARFKRVGYSMMESVMKAGAMGVEILISGPIPGARAKTWRFYQGYLKKSGSVAQYDVDHAIAGANLKRGTLGIQVRIMRKGTKLPDEVIIRSEGLSVAEKRTEAAKSAGVSLPKIETEEGFEKGEEVVDVDVDEDIEDANDAKDKGAEKKKAKSKAKVKK